jgi:two-component system sensor histidine kinase AlgZ
MDHRVKEPAPPLVPVLAALPVCACMAILGLPALADSYAAAFRALYFGACMVWIVPLALIQRALWRHERSWPFTALVLLGASYAMSIALGLADGYRWSRLVQGLDGCWLALIVFCAIHAVAVYYLSLQRAQLRLAQALAHARDAELRALRLQVNPHFLFNTLNAVSALVSAQANREANRMLASVSSFLRATLAHDGRHEHALAEELALTEAYLDIEKARLGERLQLGMQAGPDLLDAAVPYLVLQPLAENAIRHGIAQLALPGRLDIRIERAGARRAGLSLAPRGHGRRTPVSPRVGAHLHGPRRRPHPAGRCRRTRNPSHDACPAGTGIKRLAPTLSRCSLLLPANQSPRYPRPPGSAACWPGPGDGSGG